MDATFVTDRLITLGIHYDAHQRDPRIREDFGSVGFANSEEAAYFRPSPKTIKQSQIIPLTPNFRSTGKPFALKGLEN